MALEIKKEITTEQGMTVPSGAFIKFSTKFGFDGYTVSFLLDVYASKTQFSNGKSPLTPEEFSLYQEKQLTETEYYNLGVISIHDHLKDSLLQETGFADNEIEIIT